MKNSNLVDLLTGLIAENKGIVDRLEGDELGEVAVRVEIGLEQAISVLNGTESKEERKEALAWWNTQSLTNRKRIATKVIGTGKPYGSLNIDEVVLCSRFVNK